MAAQTVGSIDLGASYIEYDGFLASGAAVLAPSLSYDTRNVALGAQGSWTVFESGNQVWQATAAAAWFTRPRAWWRAELSGSAGVSRYAAQPISGHALARTRLHLVDGRRGAWASAAAGTSFDTLTRTPFEVGIGLWTVRERLALVTTVTRTWMGGNHYLDVAGTARWTQGRTTFELRGGFRPWAANGEATGEASTGVYGDVSALVALSGRAALAVSGGGYPSDPVRRVLGARYVSAALRVTLRRADLWQAPILESALLEGAAEYGVARETGAARLEVQPAATRSIVRVVVGRARSVAVRGDFTDWTPLALADRGDGIWEVRLPLEPGAYRVQISIDDGPWTAPAGTRREETEFGEVVGVVIVP